MAPKYKVGDRVRIKSIDWYNENKDKDGIVELSTHIFTPGMSEFCGDVLTIEDVFEDIDDNGVYLMEIIDYDWTDEMIEGLVEEETKPKFKVGDILFYRGETCGYLKVEEIRVENGEIRYYETSRNLYLIENDPNVFADKVCSVETEETKNNNDMEEKETLLGWVKESDNLRLVPHKDYEIKHDGDNFYLVKKKMEYPKTYLGCCDILEIQDIIIQGVRGYLKDKLETLQELLICRDAYWKIYGEANGMGEPWKPDWDDGCYVIVTTGGGLIARDIQFDISAILAFPTAELRDMFYERFKTDIEICKELL